MNSNRRQTLGMGTDAVQTPSKRPLTASTAMKAARKYRNTPMTVNGLSFDSKREAERYGELVVAERAGDITNLDVHPRFPLVVHEQDCGYYEADFRYLNRDGQPIVEDVKSPPTRKLSTYRLKRALVWALYGIRILEV